jgi:hypothetical protein
MIKDANIPTIRGHEEPSWQTTSSRNAGVGVGAPTLGWGLEESTVLALSKGGLARAQENMEFPPFRTS